jgi:chromosome segregation ATPase
MLSKARGDYDTLNKNYNTTKDQLSAVNADKQELIGQLNAAVMDGEISKKDAEDLKNKLAELEVMRNTEVGTAYEEQSKLNAILSRTKKQLASQRSNNKNLTKNLNSLAQEYKDYQDAHSAAMSQANAELALTAKERNAARRNLDDFIDAWIAKKTPQAVTEKVLAREKQRAAKDQALEKQKQQIQNNRGKNKRKAFKAGFEKGLVPLVKYFTK